ncbi:hypothetical protein [Streptomyces sp. NPDC006610]|uniref:hypothetical protein n=1 Tax=Streptomyces sp. NPDC006610 TaxID=3154584 RepID=UPI0033BF5216
MRDQLLAIIGGREGRVMAFSALADATSVPSVGRATIVRLLWHRELDVDLGSPLRDSSLIWGGVMAARAFLQIAPGRRVALSDVEWTVGDVHGQFGRLVPVDGGGHAETRSFRWLINHADLRLLPAAEVPGRPAPVSRQPRTLADLTARRDSRGCRTPRTAADRVLAEDVPAQRCREQQRWLQRCRC